MSAYPVARPLVWRGRPRLTWPPPLKHQTVARTELHTSCHISRPTAGVDPPPICLDRLLLDPAGVGIALIPLGAAVPVAHFCARPFSPLTPSSLAPHESSRGGTS